jgi:hypothetical protein
MMDQHPMDESPVARLVTRKGVAPNETAVFESHDFDYPPVGWKWTSILFFSGLRFSRKTLSLILILAPCVLNILFP